MTMVRSANSCIFSKVIPSPGRSSSISSATISVSSIEETEDGDIEAVHPFNPRDSGSATNAGDSFKKVLLFMILYLTTQNDTA